MISSPYCAVSEPNVYKHCKRLTRWNANRCFSSRTTYLISETFKVLFPTASLNFYGCEGFRQVIYQKEWSITLRIDNGGWHETLNLLHVSRCEMLHFVTFYMKRNKSRKQTLESAQYGLEISFKLHVLPNRSENNGSVCWIFELGGNIFSSLCGILNVAKYFCHTAD